MSRLAPFTLVPRKGPLIISIPHLGSFIPDELRELYTPEALEVEDTDRHLDQLYAFTADIGATVIATTLSRYVVDLNRPASGESLYPGMITTSLCPTETFRGAPIYRTDSEPSAIEITRRVETYWRPYHEALRTAIARLRGEHSNILLWEAHSIASVLPRLFPGKLPDLNFGTSDGQSCGESVIAGAIDAVRGSPWSWVVNGRFKGGFITRRYGAPDAGVHAIQLELCQSTYMEEATPFDWRPDRAEAIRPVIRAAVQGALDRLPQRAAQVPAESVSG